MAKVDAPALAARSSRHEPTRSNRPRTARGHGPLARSRSPWPSRPSPPAAARRTSRSARRVRSSPAGTGVSAPGLPTASLDTVPRSRAARRRAGQRVPDPADRRTSSDGDGRRVRPQGRCDVAASADRMVLNMVTVDGARSTRRRATRTPPSGSAQRSTRATTSGRGCHGGSWGISLRPATARCSSRRGTGNSWSSPGHGPAPRRSSPGCRNGSDRRRRAARIRVGDQGPDRRSTAAVGISEICLVPPAPDLPSSRRTLEAFAQLATRSSRR